MHWQDPRSMRQGTRSCSVLVAREHVAMTDNATWWAEQLHAGQLHAGQMCDEK
jgi:hypothetical protein